MIRLTILTILLLKHSANAQDCLDPVNYPSRVILPDEIDPFHYPPPIHVGNRTFSSNEPHRVFLPDKSDKIDDILRVVIPGTTDSPEEVSCLLASLGKFSTTIGLSYAFLDSSDAARNGGCGDKYLQDNSLQSESSYSECLRIQHVDALYGGDSEPSIWTGIAVEDSILGRLSSLLDYLNNQFPEEDWLRFLDLSKVWFLGHSQGAGHVAFLSQEQKLAGATLLSGPQDDCTKVQHCWLDNAFMTSNIKSFSHAKERYIGMIEYNLDLIYNQVNSQPVIPYFLENIEDTINADQNRILTLVEAGNESRCMRPIHCSTAHDYSAPLRRNLEKGGNQNPYAYSDQVWPELAGLDMQMNQGYYKYS